MNHISKRSKESGFIYLKGRTWTEPSTVIDDGRYAVGGVGESPDNSEKMFSTELDSNKC